MATYPRTGSILDSTTHTALSTQVVIMVNNEPVGAVQKFSINQSRTNKRVGEIGTDGTIELVPQKKADITLNINRIAFDGLSLPESFARGFRNIQAQRISFDIVVPLPVNLLGINEYDLVAINCSPVVVYPSLLIPKVPLFIVLVPVPISVLVTANCLATLPL